MTVTWTPRLKGSFNSFVSVAAGNRTIRLEMVGTST